MNPLPWQNPNPSLKKLESSDETLGLSLYDVTGPYGFSAYVIADSGQDAIDALVRRPDSLWGRLGVWDEQCQAEYLGQTQVPRKQWSYMLADMQNPHGLILSKSQD
jgi:hypothetical protein